MNDFIKLLREAFYKRLERKTGWGRNELKSEFEQAATEALVRILTLQDAHASLSVLDAAIRMGEAVNAGRAAISNSRGPQP